MMFGLTFCGSDQEVPTVVSKSFKNKYKQAENISWSSDKESYLVDFEHNDFVKRARFAKDGKWEETITELPIDDLMTCIIEFVGNTYKDGSVKDGKYLETPDAEEYHITISYSDENDSNEEDTESENEEVNYVKLIFDADCEFVKEE